MILSSNKVTFDSSNKKMVKDIINICFTRKGQPDIVHSFILYPLFPKSENPCRISKSNV